MKTFEYITPETIDEALELLGEGAQILAGGTDLLGEMKRGLATPKRLINLKGIQGLADIRSIPDGFLTIGSLATLSHLAEHPLVAQHYPLLIEALQRTASPQIRNIATVGGNLCQRPRCWYYRHSAFPCIRKHGEGCFAMGGQDRYHAIFGGHRCFIVHPSDLAPALMALDAEVRIAHADDSRIVPLTDFFVGPRDSLTQENILTRQEILTAIRIPVPPDNAYGTYLKVSERKATDFALASVAVSIAWLDTQVTHARVVLGGVAPVPWRVKQVEEMLIGDELSGKRIERACERAVDDATPLRHNRYKVALVKGLLRKALHAAHRSREKGEK